MVTALHDAFYQLRDAVLKKLTATDLDAALLQAVENIARHDENSLVRASAIDVLAKTNNTAYTDLFVAGTRDSSYSVAGASLSALSTINAAKALSLLPSVKNDAKDRLQTAVQEAEALTKTRRRF